MRSCALWILACAIICAAEGSDPIVTSTDIGETFPTTLRTSFSSGSFTCHLRTPSGVTIEFMPTNEGNPDKYTLRSNVLVSCAVDVKVTDRSDEGVWALSVTPNEGETVVQEYQVTLNTPAETTTTPDRNIEHLNDQFFNSSLGENLKVTISYFDFVQTESCHLKTPNGEQYNLDDINIKGIEVIKDREVACGVEVNVSEELVGTWTLFSRDTRLSTPIERRLNFTIHIEEIVRASPEEITITEGNDLFVRLANPTLLRDTCKLIDPNGNTDINRFSTDDNHRDECGFIVPNIRIEDSGRWEIEYGERIVYKAQIQVTVNAPVVNDDIILEWVRDQPVDELVGPADAVYCRMVDPAGLVVFEGFERCRVTLGRAASRHAGTWRMTLGLPGKVIAEDRDVTVSLRKAETRPRVITRVEKQAPEVLLTCGLEGNHTITSCKFRDPSMRVLLATQGVGEDRYSAHGNSVSLQSNVDTTHCGLRITNPVFEDMGLWRCAIETDDDEVYYGFMKVLCPFATSQPGAPPVVTVPVLTAAHRTVEAVEDDSVTMSCSIQSEIRYCYFRARNGTVFSVSPGTQSDMFEYAGAGFDAGDCGATFRGLRARDTGAWSCHVGLAEAGLPEQRASFAVNIQRAMNAFQHPARNGLTVTGRVYDSRAVEYCRFVRINGLGFTTENLPEGFQNEADLSSGLCQIFVPDPTMLDHHPWTVAARIVGQSAEVSGTTDHSIETEEPPAPGPQPPRPPPPARGMSSSTALILVILLSLTFTMLVLTMVTSKNRQWAYTKATAFRNSFRRKSNQQSAPATAPMPNEPAPPYTPARNAV